jgi:glutathione S-transferase
MKLHVTPGSPNSRKVLAVVSHLGLKLEIVEHDFASLSSEAYRQINPNGMVPVFERDGFRLWESNAIMQYLAERVGDEALYPRDTRVRAEIARWQFWEAAHYNRAFSQVGFELVAKAQLGIGPADTAAVEAGLRDLARFAPVLEAHVAGRQFVVGETLTIADYSVAALGPYRDLIPFDFSPYPALNAYMDRVIGSEHWPATAPVAVAA